MRRISCSCPLLPRQLCQFSLEQNHGTLGACEFQLEDEQRRYSYVKAAERSP